MNGYVLKGKNGHFMEAVEGGYKIYKDKYTVFDTRDEAKEFFEKYRSEIKKYGFSVVNEKNAIKYLKNKAKQNDEAEVKAEEKQTKHNRIKFSKETRKRVYRKSEGKCCLCGKFVDYEDFTVDHIIPLAGGGTNYISNLQCACKRCNSIKQDIMPDDLMDVITEMLEYGLNKKYNKKIGNTLLKTIIKNKFSFRK